MLVCACLAYARQGTPFTIPVFAELARNFAGRKEDQPFSRHFVTGFVERHSHVLSLDDGIITSPTRSSDAVLQLAKGFIDKFKENLVRGKMNSKNIFVFDETIIGANPSPPLVVGERKNSAGGNNNVIQTSESALGSFIPFSMVDGSTSFRVFILRTKEHYKSASPDFWLAPKAEKYSRNAPHRLFLSSESGYISTELFACIMEDFAKWWTTIHPGLECYLICDNLSIHCNKDIVADAEKKGIHFLYIMPGTSHWFQVHDQQPFAELKKNFMIEKNKCFASFFLPRDCFRALFSAFFYKAEAIALAPSVLISAFECVGLWPFNPDKIIENCLKFCSVQPEPDDNDDLSNITRAFQTCMRAEYDRAVKSISDLECVRLTSPKNVKKRKRSEQKPAKSRTARGRRRSTSTVSNVMDSTLQPVRKRGRPAKPKDKK